MEVSENIMQAVTAKIPLEMNSRLEGLAKELDRNKSYLIRQAVADYLEEQEDYLIAVARLAKKGKRIPLEELIDDLED